MIDCANDRSRTQDKICFAVDGPSLETKVPAGTPPQPPGTIDEDLFYGSLPRDILLRAMRADDTPLSDKNIAWLKDHWIDSILTWPDLTWSDMIPWHIETPQPTPWPYPHLLTWTFFLQNGWQTSLNIEIIRIMSIVHVHFFILLPYLLNTCSCHMMEHLNSTILRFLFVLFTIWWYRCRWWRFDCFKLFCTGGRSSFHLPMYYNICFSVLVFTFWYFAFERAVWALVVCILSTGTKEKKLDRVGFLIWSFDIWVSSVLCLVITRQPRPSHLRLLPIRLGHIVVAKPLYP